jgi:archaellum component FlaC
MAEEDILALRGSTVPEPVSPLLRVDPTPVQTLGAAFRLDNPIFSVFAALSGGNAAVDENFNPLNEPGFKGSKYEQRYLDDFVSVTNRDQYDSLRARIDQEDRDRETLDAAGGWGTAASVLAGLLDPTLLIPIGGEISAARGAVGIARTAARVGAYSGFQAGVSEAALQASQITRTGETSAISIGTGTILGALLGSGAAALLSRPERAALEQMFEADRVSVGRSIGFDSSVGAAQTDARQLELVEFTPGWVRANVPPSFQDRAAEWLLSTSPTLRTFRGGNVEAKRAMADLVETPLRFKDAEQGVTTAQHGTTVDRLVRATKANLMIQSGEELKSAFVAYRGLEGQRLATGRALLEDVTGQAGERLSYGGFKAEVTRALMNGDVHEIPQVQQAAQAIRKNVLDPTQKWLQKIGLLPEELEGAAGDPTWFARLPNRETIAARRSELRDIITDWLDGEQATKAATKERLSEMWERKQAIDAQVAKLDAVLERIDVREQQTAGALRERASDVKRLDSRVDVLSDRVGLLKEEASELVEFINTMRQTIRDPATLARLDELDAEARRLGRVEESVTPNLQTLVDLERQQADEIIGEGARKHAVAILTGKRKYVREQSFAHWVARQGGVKMRDAQAEMRLNGRDPNLGDDRAQLTPLLDAKIPGLVRKTAGRTLDEWGERLADEFPSIAERLGPDEVQAAIEESLRSGRNPWWFTEAQLAGKNGQAIEASKISDAIEEALSSAGLDRTREDIAKLLSGQEGRLRFAEVDEMLARMEQMAEGTAIQRTRVEDDAALIREDFAKARAALTKAQERQGTVRGAISREGARLSEAELAARPARNRLEILRDRTVLYDIKRDITNEARAIAEREADELRARMEQDLRDWKGNSSADAVSALKARDKAAEGRAPDEPRLRAADPAVDRVVKRILDSDRDLSRDELGGRADEIINRWLGGPDGRLPYDAPSGGPRSGVPSDEPPARGSLNAREWAIPTNLIWDFVEHDTEHLLHRVLGTVLPDGFIAERFGDVEMRQAFRKLDEDANRRVAAAKSDAERTKIEKERQRNIEDLAAVRDKLRGVYGLSDDPMQRRAAKLARIASGYNTVTDLGTAALNSMGDMAGVIFRYGLGSTFRDGWAPFLASMASRDEFKGAALRQAKAAQIAVETALNLRSHALTDVLEQHQPGSKFERGVRWAADKSQLVNGQAWFTDTVKTVAASVVANDMLRAMQRVVAGTATKQEIANLAARNISAADAAAIWRQFENGGGEVIRGVRLANTEDWTDARLRQVFEGALAREVDIAVVTPGAEKALWMSRPVGSLLGQFKGFVAGTHERTLLAQMQQRDGRTLAGLFSAVALGILSYRFYTLVSGRPFETDPKQLVKEGISRSGVTGWMDEINSITAKATRGQVDMYKLIGADKPLSRYASRSILATFLGPTAGKVEGVAAATGGALSGDFTGGDTTRLRRLLPYQNLFFLRGLINEAEVGFNETMGIPQKQPPQGATPALPF